MTAAVVHTGMYRQSQLYTMTCTSCPGAHFFPAVTSDGKQLLRATERWADQVNVQDEANTEYPRYSAALAGSRQTPSNGQIVPQLTKVC